MSRISANHGTPSIHSIPLRAETDYGTPSEAQTLIVSEKVIRKSLVEWPSPVETKIRDDLSHYMYI